jgi:hypothetical protein
VLVNWENGDRRTSEGIVRDRLSARVSDAGVLRVKESTKLRIYCVWSISQSNYLVPLFCDSMLALCSLILSSGVLLIVLATSMCQTSAKPCRAKTELCTRHLLANSSVARRAQPQIAVEQLAD